MGLCKLAIAAKRMLGLRALSRRGGGCGAETGGGGGQKPA